MDYSRHYRHGPRKKYDQLFFYSKYKVACDKLLIFGGDTYRVTGGFCWVSSSRKELIAIAKLMEAEALPMRDEMNRFVRRMIRKSYL